MLERSSAFTHSVGIDAFALVYPRTAEPDAAAPATRTALVLEHQYNTGTCSVYKVSREPPLHPNRQTA